MWKLRLLVGFGVLLHCAICQIIHNVEGVPEEEVTDKVINPVAAVNDNRIVSPATALNSNSPIGEISNSPTTSETQNDSGKQDVPYYDAALITFLERDNSCQHSDLTEKCKIICAERHIIPLCEIDVDTCFCLRKHDDHYVKVLVLDMNKLITDTKESRDKQVETTHGKEKGEENVKQKTEETNHDVQNKETQEVQHDHEITAIQVYSPEEAIKNLQRVKRTIEPVENTASEKGTEGEKTKETEVETSNKEKEMTGEKQHVPEETQQIAKEKEGSEKVDHVVEVKPMEKLQDSTTMPADENVKKLLPGEVPFNIASGKIPLVTPREPTIKEETENVNDTTSLPEQTRKDDTPDQQIQKITQPNKENTPPTKEDKPQELAENILPHSEEETVEETPGSQIQKIVQPNDLSEDELTTPAKHKDKLITEEEMNKAVLNQTFILSAVLVYIVICALFLYIRSFRKRRYTRIPMIPTGDV